MKTLTLIIISMINLNFCLGQTSSEFKDIEALLKKEVSEMNGKRSKINKSIPVHNRIEKLTAWLISLPQVIDAENDNCGEHTIQYPGYRKIGIKLNNANELAEIVFQFQIGKTPARKRKKNDENELIYISYTSIEDFILTKRQACDQLYQKLEISDNDTASQQLKKKNLNKHNASGNQTRYDSLVGFWVDSTGISGFEIEPVNHPPGATGIEQMSSLKIKWKSSIDAEDKPRPVIYGRKRSETNDYDFGQDTWMQDCAYYYRIIEMKGKDMILEFSVKKGLTSTQTQACYQEGKVIRYKLLKTNKQ